MKTKYQHLIASFLFLFLFVECSYNNGGDEELWGTWQLASIEIAGSPVTDYGYNYFWKFQSDVILIQEVDDIMHEHTDHFGTWTLEDDARILLLNFSHGDNNTSTSQGVYSPPSAIGIDETLVQLDIIVLKSGTMILEYENPLNVRITYTLKRFF